jgi:hypothetical protein
VPRFALRRAVALAASAGAAALAACDPCSGVASCRVRPRVGVGGQIVERRAEPPAPGKEFTGIGATPVGGVRVQVIRTGGVATTADTASAVSDGTGWWQAEFAAAEPGLLTADAIVAARDTPPYRVTGLVLRASDRRGEGNVVGRWTRAGFISAIGEIVDAATGAPVSGARVTATRAGGAELAPSPATRSPMVTEDGSGRFFYDVRLATGGDAFVDFTIERDGYRPAVVRGVRIAPQYEWIPPNVNGDLIFRVAFQPAGG